MRNPIARVVLGAGLVVSVTAQAPTAPTNPQPANAGRTQSGTSLGSTALPGLRDRLIAQDEVDYSLVGQFRQHHGEFMDRYERYDPNLELRARVMPNQRIGDEPGGYDLFGYDFDLEIPSIITTESYLTFGLYQYGRRYLTSSNFGTASNGGNSIPDETLTAAGVRLGIGVFFADNVLFEFETNPGVYSDLDGGLHHKDYDFPSSALFTVRTMDNFFFKVGARYNQIYADAPWLPYLGFSWEVVEGLRIDLLAPEMVEISWWPSASTAFSIGAFAQGAEYHVRTSEAQGKQRADMRVQEVVTYLGLTQRFTDSFSLQVRGGLVVAGDYEFSTGGATFDPAEGALDQALYVDVTMGIDW